MVNALLIENEIKLINTLEEMLHLFCPQVTIRGKIEPLQYSADRIKEFNPELIFLDIEKIYNLGIDLVSFFNKISSEVIFVTAARKYAVQAIKCRAAGYLLKPIVKDELIFAVDNAIKRINEKKESRYNKLMVANLLNSSTDNDMIGIPTIEGFEFISIHDIIRCEGLQKCTRVITTDRSDIISSYNLGEFRKILEPHGFYSPHKSHLINLKYIRKYHKEGNIMLVNNSYVPVAKRKKKDFLNQVKRI